MALRAKKHFKDYVIVQSLQADGTTKNTLEYRGDWYIRCLSPKARFLERCMYIILSMLGFVFLILAMNLPIAPNISYKLTQGISIFALVPVFCVTEGSLEAFFRKGDLKKENYRERLLMLRIMGVISTVLLLFLSLSYGHYAFSQSFFRESIMAVLFSSLSFICFGLIVLRECRVKYQVRKAPPRPLQDDEGESPQYSD